MELIVGAGSADPRLADFRDLSDADVRPDRRGVVIAEGANVVERLVRSPYAVRAVAGVPARIEALRPVLEPLSVPVFELDKWTLSDVVGFRVTRGVLASADRPAPLDPAHLVAGARRVAVLESLNDFENLGALFRNAAAFGGGRGAARRPLRRPAVPAQRAGVDGARPAGAVRGAGRAVAGVARRAALGRFHAARRDPGCGRRRTAPARGRGALGGAVRRRGSGAVRPRRSRRPTCGCGSRWRRASTR